MALRIRTVTMDCNDPDVMGRFWSQVTGREVVDHGQEDPYWALVDPERRDVTLLLQKVAENKRTKNRVHLDLHTPDLDAEVKRVMGLGARLVGRYEEDGEIWVWCEDPERNEFCIVQSGAT
ncbi:MAG: VOC family protein [Actinomycetota bacterium]|nr:VOC family protein [Actinomycetota bacterium]